jgi:hypothetical protein
VRYVKGKDKILMVGLTPLLIKPITTAAIKAAGKLAISTPGTTKSTISKLKAVASAMKKYDNIFTSVTAISVLITIFKDRLIFHIFS